MDTEKLHNVCKSFAEQLKEIVEGELKKGLRDYQTDQIRLMVIEETKQEYAKILQQIANIEQEIKYLSC